MRTFLVTALALWSLSACQKEEAIPFTNRPTSDYLIFGDHYPFCQGASCTDFYKIEGDQLFEDTLDAWNETAYVELAAHKYNEVADLKDLLPAALFQLGDEIGCLGCLDQGMYYLEYSHNGTVRTWKIDSDKSNIPASLHTFVDTLRHRLDRLAL